MVISVSKSSIALVVMLGKIGQGGCENYPELAVKPSFLQDAEALVIGAESPFDRGALLLLPLYDEPNERYDAVRTFSW